MISSRRGCSGQCVREPATGSLALGPNESRELTVKVGRANAAGQALLLELRLPDTYAT